MHVSVEKDEKSGYELGSEFTRCARSRHHVEEVMSRILAKQHPNTRNSHSGMLIKRMARLTTAGTDFAGCRDSNRSWPVRIAS